MPIRDVTAAVAEVAELAPRRPTEAPSETKPRRHDQRKTQIVDIAARLFAEHGYHATSIQQIIDATGAQRGTLYHYIESKQDLLLEIYRRFIDPLLAEAHEIEARDERPDVMLRLLGRTLMRNIHEYHDQVTVFLQEWRSIQGEDSRATVRSARREFEAIFERVFERGVREGTFQIAETRVATLAFLGMINFSSQWFTPEGRLGPDEMADQFVDIFLDGVMTAREGT
jgi:AcrR family transcriptional regulator